MIYAPGTVLGDRIEYRWEARDQENTVDGEPSPSPGLSVFAASFCIMKVVIVMEEVDIFTSRTFFTSSLSEFLELMGVSGSGDHGVL